MHHSAYSKFQYFANQSVVKALNLPITRWITRTNLNGMGDEGGGDFLSMEPVLSRSYYMAVTSNKTKQYNA